MSVEKWTERLDNLIENNIDALSRTTNATQIAIFKRIMDLLYKQSSKGYLLNAPSNLNILNEIEKIVKETFAKKGFDKEFTGFLKSFDEIFKNTAGLQGELNGIKLANAEISPFMQHSIDLVTDNMVGAGLNTNFVNPIKESLFKNITAGSSISNIEKELRLLIAGDAETLGRFERYATQMARDSLYQFNGTLNSYIAKEYELDAYLYVGSIKPGKKGKKGGKTNDSRPQCVRWVKMGEILVSELQKEINWAYANGRGMIPGTTVDNFVIYRGGYNCRHEAIPIRSSKK